jgi:flagellar biosynthesis protein FlhG
MNSNNTAQKLKTKDNPKVNTMYSSAENSQYYDRLAYILDKKPIALRPQPKHQRVKVEPKPEYVQKTRVVAIGGSKGGIGKTSFTASLALELASQGQNIIAVDADFGDPDLKDWLGLREPRATLDHFFKQQIVSLKDLVLESPIENLRVICGDSQSMETSYPFFGLRLRFLKQLKELKSDYVLLDLGPGISYNNIDTFLAADERILVMVPEPSSIMSAFRFIRIAMIRHLKKVVRGYTPVIDLISQYETPEWHNKYASITPLLKRVERVNMDAAEKMNRALQTFNIKIVLNMVMVPTEIAEGSLFAHALFYLLRIKASFLGPVAYNATFRNSSKAQRPFLILNEKNDKMWKDHNSFNTRWSKFSNRFKKTIDANEYESIVKNIFGPLVPNWPDIKNEKDYSMGHQ